MPAENVQHFNLQVLRAMAALYNALPDPITLDHALFYSPASGQSGGEYGTILWLHNNGLVTGDLTTSEPLNGEPLAAITSAQPSTRAMRVLNSIDKNLGAEVGPAIVANVDHPRRQVYADRLMHLLLNG